MFSTADTIAAIATPPGHGGIGIVRISGPGAAAIASRLLAIDRPLAPRHATFTKALVRDESGGSSGHGATATRAIDHAIATFFPAPHSYTGDDVVEVAAHGSPVVMQAILRAAIAHGARLAEPGEFTLRAFLNGRMDLVQAEAVADLVDAVTPEQARAAFDQLEGTLTGAIAGLDRRLFDLVARLEASIDFPDEGYHFVAASEVAAVVGGLVREIDELVRQGQAGRVLREGRQIAVAGKPNVGKSTLFNRLLGRERAIVTPVAGTTRDLVSETTVIDGARMWLVDTAGMREAATAVEREGVRRARNAVAVADLVVLVLDRSRLLEDEDRELMAATEGRPRVIVVNKCDLPAAWTVASLGAAGAGSVEASLRNTEDAGPIARAIGAALSRETVLGDVPAVTNARHIERLNAAREALLHAQSATADERGETPEEIVLEDLRDAQRSLEEMTGRRTADDLLHHIFSRFCIGK
jgi:tRNA modification GTPase